MQTQRSEQNAWQTGKISLDSLNIHYTRTGSDNPALVLSHGISDDGLCWTPVTRIFEKAYDIVMVDARGHGFSDGCEGNYGPPEQAADLAGVISNLKLHKPVLIGHSMGAVTTLLFASLHPDIPRGIILEDPPDWWVSVSTKEQAAAHHQGLINWISALKSKSRQELIAEEHAHSPLWSEEELEPWADSKLRCNLETLSRLTSTPAASVDWSNLLPQVKCPCLLITADTGLGAIVSHSSAQALKKIIPQLKIAHIGNAGHNIRRDQFELYTSAVKAFLADLEPN